MDTEKTIPERYRCKYDKATGCWRILDTWHPQIKNIKDFSENIPDNSPALKIVSDLEMNAVIEEMIRLGWLDKFKDKEKESTTIINNYLDLDNMTVKELLITLIKNLQNKKEE